MTSYPTRNYIMEFFRILLTCQTVVSEKFKYEDGLVYNGSSPGKMHIFIYTYLLCIGT